MRVDLMRMRERELRRVGFRVFKASAPWGNVKMASGSPVTCPRCLLVYSPSEDATMPLCPLCGSLNDD